MSEELFATIHSQCHLVKYYGLLRKHKFHSGTLSLCVKRNGTKAPKYGA